MTSAGIVIVTYNSESVVGACLDAAAGSGCDIVVVDNASSDGTRAEVARRRVRLIANEVNRGFAAAVNQGVRALDAGCILLLNPDARLLTGIDDLRRACELPRTAGAGGQLLDSRGRPQIGFMVRSLPKPAAVIFEALLINRLWPANPVNRRYRCLDLDPATPQPVDQPAGALMMIRRDVWESLGGFDEGFHPLWFEDVDFCQRARNAGLMFLYVPTVRAQHDGAHSLSSLSLEARQLYWYGSLFRYTALHYSTVARWMVCVAVAAGALMRMFGRCAQGRFTAAAAHGRAALLAAHWLRRGRRGDTKYPRGCVRG
jgi:GT2 family glycosyltransferase